MQWEYIVDMNGRTNNDKILSIIPSSVLGIVKYWSYGILEILDFYLYPANRRRPQLTADPLLQQSNTPTILESIENR